MTAQTKLCKTYKQAVLVSTGFEKMAEEGLMKDPYHYEQEAYNMAGTEAGANTAYHILTGKEPELHILRK